MHTVMTGLILDFLILILLDLNGFVRGKAFPEDSNEGQNNYYTTKFKTQFEPLYNQKNIPPKLYYTPHINGRPIYLPVIRSSAIRVKKLPEDHYERQKDYTRSWTFTTPSTYGYHNKEGDYYEDSATDNSLVKNILEDTYDSTVYHGDYHILPITPESYVNSKSKSEIKHFEVKSKQNLRKKDRKKISKDFHRFSQSPHSVKYEVETASSDYSRGVLKSIGKKTRHNHEQEKIVDDRNILNFDNSLEVDDKKISTDNDREIVGSKVPDYEYLPDEFGEDEMSDLERKVKVIGQPDSNSPEKVETIPKLSDDFSPEVVKVMGTKLPDDHSPEVVTVMGTKLPDGHSPEELKVISTKRPDDHFPEVVKVIGTKRPDDHSPEVVKVIGTKRPDDHSPEEVKVTGTKRPDDHSPEVVIVMGAKLPVDQPPEVVKVMGAKIVNEKDNIFTDPAESPFGEREKISSIHDSKRDSSHTVSSEEIQNLLPPEDFGVIEPFNSNESFEAFDIDSEGSGDLANNVDVRRGSLFHDTHFIGGLTTLNSNIWSLIFNPNAEFKKVKKCVTRSNEPGFCMYVQHCDIPNVVTSLEQLLNDACVIDDIFIGICCPEFPVQTVKVHWEELPTNSIQRTDEDFSHKIEDCGIRSDSARKAQSWPWKAPLVSMSNGRIFCDGVLIRDNYVLTAAHCTTKIPKNQILVRIGQHDESSGEDFAVVEIKRHAQYNRRSMRNDIALLKLGRRIEHDRYTNTICIPDDHDEDDDDDDDDDHAGEVAILIGSRGSFSISSKKDELLKVKTNKECQKKFGIRVPSTMLCTEARDENERTCNTDSGAPLIVKNDDKYEVIGILSWNRNDCDQRFPSIFSRVSKYVRWIKRHTV